MLQFEKKILSLLLFIGLFLLIVAYYTIHLLPVKGPFIFGDETAYFRHVFNFANGGKFDPSQYGPLYPWLASKFILLSDSVESYANLRQLNILLFASCLFPLYFFFKSFFSEKYLSLVMAFFFLLRPWGSISAVLWADILFYFLYTLLFALVYAYFQSSNKWILFLSGLLFGALTVTKQAGFVFAFSFFLVSFFFHLRQVSIWQKIKMILPGALPFICVFLGSTIYNRLNAGAALGYSGPVNAMTGHFFTLFSKPGFYENIFHQFSYIVSAQFFFVPVGIAVFLADWKKQDKNHKLILYVLILTTVALSVLISAFNNLMEISYESPSLPDLAIGRYLAPLIPIWFAFSFLGWNTFFQNPSRRLFKFLAVGTFAALLLTGLCSPLRSNWSHGIVNAPDVMYILSLIETFATNYIFPWGHEHAVQFDRMYTGAFLLISISMLGLFLLFGLTFRSRLINLILIAGLGIWSSQQSLKWTHFLSAHTDDQNLLAQDIVKLKLPIEKIKFEENTITDFIFRFWYPFTHSTVLEQSQIRDELYLISTKTVIDGYENLLTTKTVRLFKKISLASDK